MLKVPFLAFVSGTSPVEMCGSWNFGLAKPSRVGVSTGSSSANVVVMNEVTTVRIRNRLDQP